MSSQGSVRQRGDKKKRGTTPIPDEKFPDLQKAANNVANHASDTATKAKETVKEAATSEWDYKLACFVITVLAFITRFWGIKHPDQVVFDEVHFGKVSKFSHGGMHSDT